MEDITPIWLKRIVRMAGLILAIPGLIVAINLFCIVPLLLLNESGTDAIIYGVVSLTITLLTLGTGAVAFWHANRSLNKKQSDPFQLPSPILLVGVFILLIGLGIISRTLLTPFFPIILLACATLPPLWAVAWMTPSPSVQKSAGNKHEETATADGLASGSFMTWRRGLLSFVGGATVSIFVAIVLEILLPIVVLSLVFNRADTVLNGINALLRPLSSVTLVDPLARPGFIFLFVQIAVIAPFVEEFAKPLVTLPLLRSLNRQQTFWIGAMAGAGFAVVENVVYATSGLSLWAGILLVRALGGALHPLGSGWMALGWRDVLRAEKGAVANWWRRFGLAVVVHALWNVGSLLVITFSGVYRFGGLVPEMSILGLSAAGATLAFLIILGLLTLWIGRALGQDKPILVFENRELADTEFVLSDQAVAIWGIVCLAAIVPAGIAGLVLWLR